MVFTLQAKSAVTGLVLICAFALCAWAEDFVVFTGQVNAGKINVRADATVNSKTVCALEKGALVEVVSEAYDWYRIRLPAEAPSYIKKDFVQCIDTLSDKCESAKVTGDKVNVRLGPNESSWIIGQAEKGTVIKVIGVSGVWYRIVPVHQSYGWINKKFVNKEIVVFEKSQASASTQAACPSAVSMQASGNIVAEGTVSPYGMVLWRKATHKLITADNKVYFLKGDRKGLNSLNRHKVRVTGKIINPENKKYPIIEAALIEVLN